MLTEMPHHRQHSPKNMPEHDTARLLSILSSVPPVNRHIDPLWSPKLLRRFVANLTTVFLAEIAGLLSGESIW